MSIDVMSAVWKLKDLADSEMLILLAMADWADKEGVCWPSIAQLSEKTNKSERTIQGAIKAIVAKGHLTRIESPGKGCKYVVHPRSGCTPAAAAPPQRTPKTPAAAAPNTLDTSVPQKASPSSGKRATPTALPADFIPNPKPGSLTAKAMAAWPPGEIEEQLEHFADHHNSHGSTSLDWQASWRTWVKNWKKFNGKRTHIAAPASDEPSNPLAAAAFRRLREAGDGFPAGDWSTSGYTAGTG